MHGDGVNIQLLLVVLARAPAGRATGESPPRSAAWLLFAMVYAIMDMVDRGHFGFENPILEPMYMSCYTASTVGRTDAFGNVAPRSHAAKAIVMVQQLTTTALLLILLTVCCSSGLGRCKG